MDITAPVSAALFYMRRRKRSQQFIAMATPWAPGLTVTAGAIVQSNQLAWQANNSGVTAGAVGPNNESGAAFTDAGGVKWIHVPLLLTQPALIA